MMLELLQTMFLLEEPFYSDQYLLYVSKCSIKRKQNKIQIIDKGKRNSIAEKKAIRAKRKMNEPKNNPINPNNQKNSASFLLTSILSTRATTNWIRSIPIPNLCMNKSYSISYFIICAFYSHFYIRPQRSRYC